MLRKLDGFLGKKRAVAVIVILVSILGILLRWQGIWYESGDFRTCLSVWMNHFKGGSGLQALSSYQGDYNMPYVTVLLFLSYLPIEPIISIKCFSILFDFVCAAAAGAIALICSKGTYRRLPFLLTYSIIFLSPISILNSGYWGQCDSVYVGFLFLAILCMLKEKFPLSMIFWGCAFAFKLQTVFGLPILLLYYWKNKKFSFLQFLLIPLTMEALCIPAIIGGASPIATFSAYYFQMSGYPFMYYFYPNFWTFFQEAPYYIFGRIAIVGTFAFLVLEAVLILKKEAVIGKENILGYLCWTGMTVLCFLPCMHERYGYLIEMAVVIYGVTQKKVWWIAVMLHVITTLAYLPGFVGYYFMDARYLAFPYLLTFIGLTYVQVRNLIKKKGEVANA